MKPFLTLVYEQNFRQLPSHFYSDVTPQGIVEPELVVVSNACADELGIDPDSLSLPDTLAVLSANVTLSNDVTNPTVIKPLAMKYTGHQFGYYNPELGDGRGVLLAEIRSDKNVLWDLHLKGAGKTPFSRQGDGRAVLRSSIREFLGSEAMAALGIPTSRALCVINSKTPVYRESEETAATLLRVSQSHLRFGHFEYAYHTGNISQLKVLCDYTLKYYYPCLAGSSNQYADLFLIIAQKTAQLIAKWQAIGFAHGVMNTDNMSILGETFDYGPFGFLDRFQPGYICNHSDHEGRYAFDRQPAIAHWNLSVLAQAMSPLVDKSALSEGLQQFNQVFNRDYLNLMSAKLGGINDEELIADTLTMLAENHLDYTFFFRHLSDVSQDGVATKLRNLCINPLGFDAWLSKYKQSLGESPESCTSRREAMNQVNPKYILRNHLAQQAIELAQKGDYSEVRKLYEILQNPFDEQPENSSYADLPPDWAGKLEISCSS